MTKVLHRPLAQVLFGLSLASLMLLMFAPAPIVSGAMKRRGTHIGPATRPMLPAKRQVAAQGSVASCLADTDPNSRADCFFREVTTVLQNPQAWQDWTGKPADGFDKLDCTTASNVKTIQTFFDSFVVLTKFQGAERISIPDKQRSALGADQAPGNSVNGGKPLSTSGIFFNKTASDYLCSLEKPGSVQPVSSGLTSRATPLGRQPANETPSINFPDGSVFVKPMWFLVPKNTGGEQIPVWAGASRSLPARSPTGVSLSSWTSFISIDDTPNKGCDFQYKNWQHGKATIPLACFFSKDFDNPTDCIQMAQNSGEDVRQPSAVDLGPQGCYLVLMALNLSAKIGQQWTFQTYWWSARAQDGSEPKRKVTPPSSDSSWQFFVMDTSPSHLYNPYLEGGFVGGTQTDCTTCHSRAEFHSSPRPDDPLVLCLFDQISNASPLQNHCQTAGQDVQTLKTDSVWSLADTNVPLKSRINGSR